MKLLVCALLATAISFAADASGVWTGSLIVSDGDDGKRPAHLVLKQDGSKLTGTAGPDASEQHPITNGKAEDGVITFSVERESTMQFSLKQEGDEIKGQVTRERDGEKQTAQLVAKREK